MFNITEILKEAKWIGKMNNMAVKNVHIAIEFPTQKAFDVYMKAHPNANPRLHTVKRQKSKTKKDLIKTMPKDKKIPKDPATKTKNVDQLLKKPDQKQKKLDPKLKSKEIDDIKKLRKKVDEKKKEIEHTERTLTKQPKSKLKEDLGKRLKERSLNRNIEKPSDTIINEAKSAFDKNHEEGLAEYIVKKNPLKLKLNKKNIADEDLDKLNVFLDTYQTSLPDVSLNTNSFIGSFLDFVIRILEK